MGKYISLVEKDGYEYVTRNIGKRGAVVIIASKFVRGVHYYQLILSTRPTFGKPILEFPAGLLDIEGESIADAALRELREETGWTGGIVISPFEDFPAPSSAGLTDEILYLTTVSLNEADQIAPAHEPGEKIVVLPLMSMDDIRVYITKHKDTLYVSSRLLAFWIGSEFAGSEQV